MAEHLTAKKLFLKVSICLGILLVVMLVCMFIGPKWSTDAQILYQIRLPRIILAAFVGAALACAGVTLQAILRNPLADPYILGISSGAALGVIIATICGISLSFWAGSTVSLFAFCGALLTVWLVWFIGHFASGSSAVTSLLLAGVVINAFFSAIIMFLISIARSHEVRATALWLMGNLKDMDIKILILSGSCILGGILILISIAAKLNVLTLGQAEAKALGVNTGRVRLIAFAVSAFITAVAVGLTGLIGFVGLIVPHGVRLVIGPDHRQLLPVSAFSGAAFLVISDTVARSAFAGSELPVGVITALVGGPFFLILLARYCRKVSWAK
ncbi:MAG: iron chelate uptake ABC transporter family permease subunit [Sedimentisphaerales bacterium]|nr:iron chelate uptake ABC transporter family permease subunit [Sedimentisphaerales bacterium]